jgi:hypothetical protein
MATSKPIRSGEDIERAVRAIAREFNTDRVFIIGSQAIQLSWPNAPASMKRSPEIDAYPANARKWEAEARERDPGLGAEASEHIHTLFGEGSQFHETHGFFIDGVDEYTAKLPKDWLRRAAVRYFDVDGRRVKAVAPQPLDVIVAKLARLDERDKDFIAAFHAARPIDPELIEKRIALASFAPEIAEQAIAYVRRLAGEHKR